MIRRLVEANYAGARESPTSKQIEFWLREARTPEILFDCARTFREECVRIAEERSAAAAALDHDIEAVEAALAEEEERERALDSFLKVIEFSPRPRALSVLNYGQSGDPDSLHFFDQAELYVRRGFKPAWFDRAEVEANAVRSYVVEAGAQAHR